MGEGAGARRPVRRPSFAEELRLEGLVVEKRRTRVETTRYLVMDLRRGSVAVYKGPPPKDEGSARGRSKSAAPHVTCENLAHICRESRDFSGCWDPKFMVPAHVDWKIRDVENDETMFYLVLPADFLPENFKKKDADGEVFTISEAGPGASSDVMVDGEENEGVYRRGSSLGSRGSGRITSSSFDDSDASSTSSRRALSSFPFVLSMLNKKGKHGPDKHEVVYMFRVLLDGNEKFIWLQAAAELGRLSDETEKRLVSTDVTKKVTKKMFDLPGVMGSGRTNSTALRYAEWAMLIDKNKSVSTFHFDVRDVGHAPQDVGNERSMECGSNYDSTRLVKVHPTYAYRNRRMTEKDLYNEMTTTSENWEDFRGQRVGDREEETIGSLYAEVLACQGLPKLDKLSSTDAVCYFVCGPYAFATDVIDGFDSPVWPSKSRRACIFPLFHAYQKFFVGVFDDDGPGARDDFAGRVVVDIACLRPNSAYDIFLPLRQHQNTFLQKPRGAIHLRLRVEWANERKALLSYLKLPTKTKELGNAVTLNCADNKAFRNVVLTVQGKDIPGRYSPLVQKALLREMKLYKMATKAAMKEQIQAIVLYVDPPTSLCIFIAWMHCVYSNSMAYVPVYFVAGIIRLLLRNYFKYGANEEFNLGFTPITLSEMLKVLFFGGPNTKYIKPISVTRKCSSAKLARGSRDELDQNGEDIVPLSSAFDSGAGLSMDGHGDHMEFPLSEAGRYSKRTLKEACVDASAIFEEDDNDDPKSSGGLFSLKDKTKKHAYVIRIPKANREDDDEDEEDEFGLMETSPNPQPNGSTLQPEKVIRSGSDEPTVPTSDTTKKVPWKRVKDPRGLPEQNAAINVKSTKSLPEELLHNKNLLQKYTKRMFDDRLFIVNEDDPGHTDTEATLHHAIGTNKYSNPVVAKIFAVFVAPGIEMLKVGLSVFRSMFNLFTWRDPFLTSLFFFGAVLLLCVLLVFPWRLFFFLMGVGAVGPQNWALRVAGKLPPKKKPKEDAAKTSEKKPKKKKTTFAGAPGNFQFHNHLATDAGTDERQKKSDKSTFSVHRGPTHSVRRAVVPNSPLISRRFYDWPPIPAHSKVDICE